MDEWSHSSKNIFNTKDNRIQSKLSCPGMPGYWLTEEGECQMQGLAFFISCAVPGLRKGRRYLRPSIQYHLVFFAKSFRHLDTTSTKGVNLDVLFLCFFAQLSVSCALRMEGLSAITEISWVDTSEQVEDWVSLVSALFSTFADPLECKSLHPRLFLIWRHKAVLWLMGLSCHWSIGSSLCIETI